MTPGRMKTPPPAEATVTAPKPGFLRGHWRLIKTVALWLGAGIGMAAIWALIEPHTLSVTRITVTKPDVPPALNGFKIAQISDIHAGPFVSRAYVRRAVRTVNALDPDLVAITGDYVYQSDEYIVPVFADLSGLRSRYGIYSVFGNHDYWRDMALMKREMKKAGIEDITGRSVWVSARGSRFNLLGLSADWSSVYQLWALPRSLWPKDLVILLFHNSDFLKQLSPQIVDLALGGHTHGGQVTLFGLFAPFLPSPIEQKYRAGVIENGPETVVVSRGLGTIGLPLRFFSPPEIILITLEHEDGEAGSGK